MKIYVNGVEETLQKSISVNDFLLSKEIDNKSVVVELNGEIIANENYESTALNDSHVVEILKILGGG